MKFRGEFKVENLHHFVGCLLSLSKLSCEHPDPLSAVIKITRQFVSVVAKTVLSSEAFLEIHTDELFHSPYILEGREDDVITLNVSVNSLYETLNAAVNSEYAALKLKKSNDVTSLSVTFPDHAFPSISITLDILIKPTDEYSQTESILPYVPPCLFNVGLTKFQSILCYLDSANKIGNELTEFEVCFGGAQPQQKRDFKGTPEAPLKDVKAAGGSKASARSESVHSQVGATASIRQGVPGVHKLAQRGEGDADGELPHIPVVLKLRSPGILADLETVLYGLSAFSSQVGVAPRENAGGNPKTVLKTDAVYTICKNAIDSIVFSKHEALLVAAIPDDYPNADWTYFIFSVTALESCQMIFRIPNQCPE